MEGPILDPQYSSFIGRLPIPLVHGLTVAELALYFDVHFLGTLPLDLEVKLCACVCACVCVHFSNVIHQLFLLYCCSVVARLNTSLLSLAGCPVCGMAAHHAIQRHWADLGASFPKHAYS